MKNKTYRIISGALIVALGLCTFNLIKAKLPTQQEKEIQQIQEAKSSVNLQEKLLEIRSKNADRLITQLENKIDNFMTFPAIYQGCVFGVNLFLQRKLNLIMLGTFDTVQLAINEIENIKNCEEEIYFIS